MRAGVVSSGIVGYNTTKLLANDYTMFGVQFENVQGGGVKFGDLTGNFNGGEGVPTADNILVWKTDGYHSYYYGVWNDPENPDWDNRWYNDETGEDASEEVISAGTACWYLRRADVVADLTISGAIRKDPLTTPILASDYTMFSNPYPMAVKFGDLTIADPFGGEGVPTADNILVWKSDGYHSYYYGVWNDPDNPEWDNCWYNDETGDDASDEMIEAGLACWYLRRPATATTLSFASPLAD